MRRILLVTHRAPDQAGGPAARWRSMARHLPAHGIEVDVVSAAASAGARDFGTSDRDRIAVERRARVMRQVGRAVDPAFRMAGLRPEALPPSTVWAVRGLREVRIRLAERSYDAIVATGPPWAALLAARAAGSRTPLVIELRDLWARNQLFDRGGPVLPMLERWVLSTAAAIVVVTDEAEAEIAHRHPRIERARFHVIPNGFEGELLALRRRPGPVNGPLTILHSGSLTPDRPLAPLLAELSSGRFRDRFRLVLNGVVAPGIRAELTRADVDVEVQPPSDWRTAVDRIAACDIALVTQARSAGDATAIAGKVYEYAALGRPVLCLSDGGATEALLRRLGGDQLCARLGDPASIRAALERALMPPPAPIEPSLLASFDRTVLAGRMAELVSAVAR